MRQVKMKLNKRKYECNRGQTTFPIGDRPRFLWQLDSRRGGSMRAMISFTVILIGSMSGGMANAASKNEAE